MSWKNVQYENGKFKTDAGGGGSSSLAGLDDTAISSPTNGQVLKYNGITSKWENADEGKHIYSTTEQIVGTWVDGKPVYETTYVFQSDVRINASSWADTPISNSGIKRIISCDTSNLQGTFWQVLGAAIDTGNYIRFFNGRSNNFIDVGIVVLQYMKTAD